MADRKADPRTVFVRGVDSSVTDAELQELFSDVGPVKKAFLVRKGGKDAAHRGFGFVQFAVAEDAARAAAELHGRELAGRKLKVQGQGCSCEKYRGLNVGHVQHADEREQSKKATCAVGAQCASAGWQACIVLVSTGLIVPLPVHHRLRELSSALLWRSVKSESKRGCTPGPAGPSSSRCPAEGAAAGSQEAAAGSPFRNSAAQCSSSRRQAQVAAIGRGGRPHSRCGGCCCAAGASSRRGGMGWGSCESALGGEMHSAPCLPRRPAVCGRQLPAPTASSMALHLWACSCTARQPPGAQDSWRSMCKPLCQWTALLRHRTTTLLASSDTLNWCACCRRPTPMVDRTWLHPGRPAG